MPFRPATKKPLGGDTDTIASIVGSIAEAYYKGIPLNLAKFTWKRLPQWMRETVELFHNRFCALAE